MTSHITKKPCNNYFTNIGIIMPLISLTLRADTEEFMKWPTLLHDKDMFVTLDL